MTKHGIETWHVVGLLFLGAVIGIIAELTNSTTLFVFSIILGVMAFSLLPAWLGDKV